MAHTLESAVALPKETLVSPIALEDALSLALVTTCRASKAFRMRDVVLLGKPTASAIADTPTRLELDAITSKMPNIRI